MSFQAFFPSRNFLLGLLALSLLAASFWLKNKETVSIVSPEESRRTPRISLESVMIKEFDEQGALIAKIKAQELEETLDHAGLEMNGIDIEWHSSDYPVALVASTAYYDKKETKIELRDQVLVTLKDIDNQELRVHTDELFLQLEDAQMAQSSTQTTFIQDKTKLVANQGFYFSDSELILKGGVKGSIWLD